MSKRTKALTRELHDKGLQQLGDVAALLRAKATPDEQEAYRAFVLQVAAKVAGAHKEEGQAVSGPEQAALDEVRARLQNEALDRRRCSSSSSWSCS